VNDFLDVFVRLTALILANDKYRQRTHNVISFFGACVEPLLRRKLNNAIYFYSGGVYPAVNNKISIFTVAPCILMLSSLLFVQLMHI
jgi:hypothetical protein